jgi:hypothetical protein
LPIIWVAEAAGNVRYHRRLKYKRAILDALPFRLDFLGEGLGTEIVHQDLDPCFPDIVAAAELVVSPQYSLDIRQHVTLGQERLDGLGEIGRAA